MEVSVGQILEPQHLRPKGVADIVVCIDCTGSMKPCIESVKTHVQQLVEGFEDYPGIRLDWRVRLIEYRDLREGEPVIQHAFTQDIQTFRSQVSELQATGGGDEPESTLDAIFVALGSAWRKSCNKCIVVFTDATSHPEMHPSTVEQGQPRDVDEAINKIYEQRARLFLFGPPCDVYTALATAERVLYEPVSEKEGLGEVDFAKVLRAIGKTVSASTEPIVEAS